MGRELARETRQKPTRNSAAEKRTLTRTGIRLDRFPAAKPPRQKKAMQMVKVRDSSAALHWGKSAPIGAANTLQPYTNPAKRSTTRPTAA